MDDVLLTSKRSTPSTAVSGGPLSEEPPLGERLPELVRQAKLKDQYDTYVADLRKKAHIEYR